MNRTEKLLKATALKPHEGILIHKPSNMFYLSGYTGEGLIAMGNGFSAIITDFRYTEQAGRQASGFSVHMVEKGTSHDQLAHRVFKEHDVTTVLFEDDCVTVQDFESIKQVMPGMHFESIKRAPEEVRTVKEPCEIELIKQACDISCKAFDYILGFAKVGMTEKQVQFALDCKMLELGGEGLAFNTIAAAGVNGSLPHAIPSDRPIEKGEMLTLDFGAKKGGYCADMTRTISFGQPGVEMRKIYDTVLRAQEECQAMLKPGISCKAVDQHAHDIIDGAGYAGRFGHGLGHGVGIDIHEAPRLSQTCDATLVEGHIVTVEPGIYVPGLGGVRIENTCAITQNGARTLVTADKALIIL